MKKALAKLEQCGLAHRGETGWVGVGATTEMLDKIAHQYDALGKAERRRELHQAEREKHATARLFEQKR